MSRRQDLISGLEKLRDSRVLVFFTGDRRGLETKIHSEVLDFFTHHLDAIGDIQKLSLFLYTRGGDTLAAWSIANILRQFCVKLEVIVPSKAHSAGTLICLAADSIVMTKQATLGPIDPSVSTPLNPVVPGASQSLKAPVSVEDIAAFVDFAKSVIGAEGHAETLSLLAASVNPLVLGGAYRARAQIRMLAQKLMAKRAERHEDVESVLKFLCSESGSHDYTINRREARDELGLPITKPDDELYAAVKALYDDVAVELELTSPYDPGSLVGAATSHNYSFHRAMIQSLPGGRHTFVTEGVLSRQQVQTPQGPQLAVQDLRTFEGWRYAAE